MRKNNKLGWYCYTFIWPSFNELNVGRGGRGGCGAQATVKNKTSVSQTTSSRTYPTCPWSHKQDGRILETGRRKVILYINVYLQSYRCQCWPRYFNKDVFFYNCIRPQSRCCYSFFQSFRELHSYYTKLAVVRLLTHSFIKALTWS